MLVRVIDRIAHSSVNGSVSIDTTVTRNSPIRVMGWTILTRYTTTTGRIDTGMVTHTSRRYKVYTDNTIGVHYALGVYVGCGASTKHYG